MGKITPAADLPTTSSRMTVFCDFDGPIVDVSDRYYNTYQLALADTQEFYQSEGIHFPIQILSKAQFWLMKQNRTPDQEIAMRSGLQGEEIDYFLGRVSAIVNLPNLLHQDKLQPGINWALALLHSRGVKLVLVTLRCQSQATQILCNNGLLRLFTAIYGSQNIDAAYQNLAEAKTQLLKKAIAEQYPLELKKKNAWMIGDTEADILAGKTLGISTIALTCGIRSDFYLKQFQPTYIKHDLLSASHFLLGINQLLYA